MALFNLSEFMTIGILNKSKNPVFRIQSITTGQEYVLKKLQRRDFQAHLSDFAELTYILRCCHHPNIIKILGFSMNYLNNEYNLCLLMDLQKTDLQRVIDNNRKNQQQMPKKQLLSLIKQLIDALYFIQITAKIAHRDLKPANILLDANDNPLITDFSEAYFADSIKNNEYREDGIKGTPEYMSPELKAVFLGTHFEPVKYNPWVSDVYSLGVLLINLASSFVAEAKISLEEKLGIIEETYGKIVKSFLEILVIEDQHLRGDFKQLIGSKEFLNVMNEMNLKDSPPVITDNDDVDGENADRISIILEGEKQDDLDENECFGRKINDLDENECFGRKVNVIQPVSSENIEEIKQNTTENSIHCHRHSSPLNKYRGHASEEMKKLKNILRKWKQNEKLNETVSEMFKKIVINIKELELENRVLLKEIKSSMLKKSSSMNWGDENKNDREKSRTASNGGMTLSDCKSFKKSMNIIYNMENKK